MAMSTTTARPVTPDADRRWEPGRWTAALLGLVAVAIAFAVAELLAALGTWMEWFSTAASPLNSLGTTFISFTPLWLERFAIGIFGTNDKTALRTGVVLAIVVVAGLIGILARRRPRVAAGVVGVLLAVTIAAVQTRTGASAFDWIPTSIGGAVGIGLLVRAFRRTPARTADTRGALLLDRRGFFKLAAWGAAVAAVGGVLSRLIPSTAEVQASRQATRLPTPLDTQTVPPNYGLSVDGLSPYITPDKDFYRIDTALAPPLLRAEDWSLTVHGLVDKPITINYQDLLKRPQVQRTITLTCVSNEVGGGLIGNATWIGARLQELIAEAGPQQGADCVLCRSVDGFTSSTPLEALTDGRDALLAVAMNGEPLPIEHGFPVRMVVPGLYGYVSATKWVTDLEITNFSKVVAYWTARGWSDHGPIKTSSRFDVPRSSAKYDEGHQVTFAGVAWAQHRGIQTVQVQVDDGPWQDAELGQALSKDTWVQWKFGWTATGKGDHTVRVRAIDGTGATQIATAQDVVPDGATGLDSRAVSVV
jgi:DMSO/TMAO reductase YedYZ molybdopterin-dependent catalytic subunit